MAKNKQYAKGERLELPVPADSVSGSPVMVGNRGGVCLTDRDDDGNASVDLKGVYKLNVNGTVNNVGEAVYYTAAADPDDRITRTSTANMFFGYALETGADEELFVLIGEASGISQIGTGDIETAMLENDVLSVDVTGRLKMQDDYFNAATALAKFAADSLNSAFLATNMEDGAITQAVALAKLAADSLDAAVLANAVEDDSFTAAVVAAKFATDSLTEAILADVVVDDAITDAVVAAKFATDALTTAILNDIVTDDAIDSTVVGAKFATDSINIANFADIVENGAVIETKLNGAGNTGLNAARALKATWDAATEGTVEKHGTGITLPDGAIVLGGIINCREELDSATDTATLRIGLENAATDCNDLLAAVLADGSLDVDMHDVIPQWAAANALLTTAERELTVEIREEAATSGIIDIFLYYVISE